MAPKQTSIRVSTFGRIVVGLGKSAHSYDIDTERFTPEVLDYVFAYGLKQVINDAAASGKTLDEKVALSSKRLEALYEGKLRAARASGNPLERHAKDIATDLGKRKGLTGEALKEFVAKAAKLDTVLHLAQKRLDEEQALDLDIDLD